MGWWIIRCERGPTGGIDPWGFVYVVVGSLAWYGRTSYIDRVDDVDISVEMRRRLSEGERSLVVAHYLRRGMTIQQLWDSAPTLLLPMDAPPGVAIDEYARGKES